MGAEILFVRDDQAGEEAFTWKRGDPIIVRPEGHRWGTQEDPAARKFFIVTITDKTAAQISSIVEEVPIDAQGNHLRLRTRRLDSSVLPAAVLEQLLTTGRLSMTFAQARAYIRNMRTGAIGG